MQSIKRVQPHGAASYSYIVLHSNNDSLYLVEQKFYIVLLPRNIAICSTTTSLSYCREAKLQIARLAAAQAAYERMRRAHGETLLFSLILHIFILNLVENMFYIILLFAKKCTLIKQKIKYSSHFSFRYIAASRCLGQFEENNRCQLDNKA